MNDELGKLYDQLIAQRVRQADPSGMSGIGIYHCRKPQSLHAIPIHQATFMLVIKGRKDAEVDGSQAVSVRPGELLILPADTTLWIGNQPQQQRREYLAIALSFSPDTIRHFRQTYPAHLDEWNITPRLHAAAPQAVLGALQQWLRWCQQYPVDASLRQHRQIEILLLLAQAGLAGNLLAREQPSWRQQVSQLLAQDTSRNWQIGDVCNALCISESSLRRRLRVENSRFRELLEEVRLVTGLSLLQETYWPVSRIAQTVGYQSQSRFGERFKQRFGMTPTELRRTRFTEKGENPAVAGEQA